MNLTDFNSDFTVTISRFDDSTSNVSVHFKIQCDLNNRVSIHTTVVDTTQLSSGYTTNDVIAEAWDNVKSAVNSWASLNILEDPLVVFTVPSTSSAIGLSTFNTHYTVTLIRFELVPTINPSYWSIYYCVTSKVKSSISNFFEGLIPLTEDYCNNTLCSNIAEAGWELAKNRACDWAANNIPSGIVDTVFTPGSV